MVPAMIIAMPKGKRLPLLFFLPIAKSARVIQPSTARESALQEAKSQNLECCCWKRNTIVRW
jgi:hypothetical protein